MPHVSKRKLNESVTAELEERVAALLTKAGASTRRRVLAEILTATERLMVAKRIALVYLLARGVPTLAASDLLGVSPSTVARFAKAVDRGGYARTAAWLKRRAIGKPLLNLLCDLAAIPFTARRTSLARFLAEMDERA